MQIAGIRAQRDQLLNSAGVAMRRTLFGNGGYGLDSLGTAESVTRTKPADLKAYHAKLIVPNNCVLAIFGDVKIANVKAAVQKAFGKWKSTGKKEFILTGSPTLLNSVKRATETRDKKQAVLIVGYAGTTLTNDDRYSLELMQEACSDLGSRLFMRIRDKLGLAYYVGAQNFVGLAPGYLAFYAGTMPEKAELVEAEILKEMEELRTNGLSQEELDRAKAKIIGQKKIAKQDLGGLAMTTALDELYGLGDANTDEEDIKFQAVTLEQVKAAAKKYLKPEAYVVAVVKPEEKK